MNEENKLTMSVLHEGPIYCRQINHLKGLNYITYNSLVSQLEDSSGPRCRSECLHYRLANVPPHHFPFDGVLSIIALVAEGRQPPHKWKWAHQCSQNCPSLPRRDEWNSETDWALFRGRSTNVNTYHDILKTMLVIKYNLQEVKVKLSL
jgi:hypothetical protein